MTEQRLAEIEAKTWEKCNYILELVTEVRRLQAELHKAGELFTALGSALGGGK